MAHFTNHYPAHRRRVWRQTLLAALGALLTLVALGAPAALAATNPPKPMNDGGWCPPGFSLADYQGTGYSIRCAYMPAWSGLTQASGDFLHVNVWTNSAVTFPPVIDLAINNAISNWNISGAHVRVVRYNTPYITFGNAVSLSGATGKRGFSSSCGNSWGVSWNGRQDDYDYIGRAFLNSALFNTCGNAYLTTSANQSYIATWTAIVGHELGHAMGMGHNYYAVPFGSYQQFQYMEGGYQPKFKDGTPLKMATYTDQYIFNQEWPQYPRLCGTQHSDYNCNGMDSTQQVCNNTYTPVWSGISYGGATVGTVTLIASSACRTNWVQAVEQDTNWRVYRIQLQRESGPDGPALTIEDAPLSSYYESNMLYAAANPARACAQLINVNSGAVTSMICTAYY